MEVEVEVGDGGVCTCATRVKDCSRAPAPTVMLSPRGPGRCLGVDKFSRGDDERTGRRRDEDGVRHLEVD